MDAFSTLFTVRVSAGAGTDKLWIDSDGLKRVSVRAKAIDGRATEAVLTVICKGLKIRPSQLKLLKGATSTSKRLATTLELSELEARWATAVV